MSGHGGGGAGRSQDVEDLKIITENLESPLLPPNPSLIPDTPVPEGCWGSVLCSHVLGAESARPARHFSQILMTLGQSTFGFVNSRVFQISHCVLS